MSKIGCQFHRDLVYSSDLKGNISDMRMPQRVEEAPRNWKATQSGNGNKVVTLTKGETL